MINARPAKPVILLTGFAPFLNLEHNPSADLATALAAAARRAFPEFSIEARTLPTEWARGPAALRQLYADLQPHIAIHFGVASKTTGFEIETRGVNATVATEDASGALPPAEHVLAGGPATVAATLPSRLILARLRALGLPARLSRDAGGYICNAILYTALSLSPADHAPRRCGFVHIPSSLRMGRRAAGPGEPSELTREAAITGGLAILAATIAARRMPRTPRAQMAVA